MAVAGAASVASGCGAQCKTVNASARPLTAQALGDPCFADESCQAGLTCEVAHGGENVPGGITACSLSCATNPCPTGAVCVNGAILTGSDAGAYRRICLPSCTSDADCQGVRAGVCLAEASDPSLKVCRPSRCANSGAPACPNGYTCQGASCGEQLSSGWCRKN
jgi:hypothetical protein